MPAVTLLVTLRGADGLGDGDEGAWGGVCADVVEGKNGSE